MTYRSSKSAGSRRCLPAPALATLAVAMGCAGPAWAIEGGAVVAGTGTIQAQRNVTTVNQSSDRMVVNWKNLDVARNQTVNFQQPGVTSAVLNRVSGSGKATEILGSINANGRVFVVNPDGVMFGKTAKVNVGSLVASTLDADNASFMKGGEGYRYAHRDQEYPGRYLHMSGQGGAVRNDGNVTATEAVAFLGREVANSGTIRARSVVLQSAGAVALRLDDAFSVDATELTSNGSVENAGRISATAGDAALQLSSRTLATGDAIGGVVRNTGVVEASRAVQGQGGSIVLAAPYDGRIELEGSLRASDGIQVSAVSEPVWDQIPIGLQPPGPSGRSYHGHDIAIVAGATLQTAGTVLVDASAGKVDSQGRITGGAVTMRALEGAIIGAPIRATAGNISIEGGERLFQNANIQAERTSSVELAAAEIVQAPSARTTGGAVVVHASNSLLIGGRALGNVRLGRIDGDSISVAGEHIVLDGPLTAQGDIKVHAESLCAQTCIPELAPSIEQNGNVTSRTGNIRFDGVKWYGPAWGGTLSTLAGNFAKRPDVVTKAAGSVTIALGDVTVGNVQAGDRITIQARRAELTGKLSAPVVTVPDNTQNVAGNIRIRR